jgi:uncharacterized protein YdeI (YjbR/CyaY-like superfamily)
MKTRPTPQATFFSTAAAFRNWLEANHGSAPELWVGFYKKSSRRPSITWPESVDEALCFGWIDGIRKSLGEEAYVIRFTPRRRGSNWSNVNIRRVEVLLRASRMHPAGVRAFEARDAKKSGVYLFEQRKSPKLEPSALEQFRANRKAWAFFEAQPPGYRRLATHWVSSAKRPETRERRLATLIHDSAAGRRIGLLQPAVRTKDA